MCVAASLLNVPGALFHLVLVPCHRSHIDYLLLSWLLYQNGFVVPHIAAGVNLNLPVVGPILRQNTLTRIQYLADLLTEAGVPPAAARRRARLLYSADLGLYQVARALGAGTPSERELRPLIREIQDAFLP